MSHASSATTQAKEAEADKAVHMIFQNKINAKNAFDVSTDFVSGIAKFLER